jgi:hypothetical protein
VKESLKLEKCPDKSAKINILLKFTFLQEIDIEQLSQISSASKQVESDDEEIHVHQEETSISKSQLVKSNPI